MYICMYVYTYVYIHTYVCMYTCRCIYIYILRVCAAPAPRASLLAHWQRGTAVAEVAGKARGARPFCQSMPRDGRKWWSLINYKKKSVTTETQPEKATKNCGCKCIQGKSREAWRPEVK